MFATTLHRLLMLFVCVGLVPGLASAAVEVTQEPLPDDPMHTRVYRLDNGLLVYLTENHESPRFYAEIATRAGSKMDPAESTGLAHYLEHLLFKGTSKMGTLDFAKEKEHLDKVSELYQIHFHETDPAKRAELYEQINQESVQASVYAVPNEMDRLYQGMGGSALNAHTWHEETVYKVELPSNRLQQWAALESERFREPIFRLFQTELETVYEEMNRSLDNKDRIIQKAVEEKLYKTHPYGQQQTLGKVEHLKNPSLQNIATYYNTWYVPNNMSIFISGDIQEQEAIKTIEQYFSSWKSKELPALQQWEEAPLQGREEVVVTYQGEEYVLLAFRTAPQNHEDAEALQLLDMVLDNANAGLINLNLNQQQRVRQAGAYPNQYNDYGSEYLWGIPKDGQGLEEVEKLLLEQLEILKRGEIEDWLIPAIITDYKKTRKAGLESDEARVAAMRESWLAFQTWEHAVHKIDRMEKLTKDDVVRVANKYFGQNYVAGLRKDAPHEVPDIKKPALAKIDIDPGRQSEFAAALLAMPVQPIEPEFVVPGADYQVETLANGVTYYYAPNPINDLFSFSIAVETGTRQDPTIGPAASLLRKSGTERFSAEELKKEWYKLGTDFGIGAGDNETSISLSGLDENFEASMTLLMELMNSPAADEQTLEELK
ncbi:MAG: insulinase family protein, partial [Candidatus Hydrogenedentes bacterium]|nr:insulinase family protein [Candidatus Hydrogenedentota bacterium]